MAVRRWPVVAAMIMGAGDCGVDARAAQPQPIYKDPRQPVERRVEDLLSRMTLDEKVAQLETVWEQKAKLQTADGQFLARARRRRISRTASAASPAHPTIAA